MKQIILEKLSPKKQCQERYKNMNDNPLEVLRNEFSELARWLKPLCRYNKIEDFIVADYKEKRLRLTFYTKDNQYHISARLPRITNEYREETDEVGKVVGASNAPIDDGYLGCGAQTRKPRAGEDWSRGRDLPDGGYSQETWQEIVNDIVAYELVKVVKKDRETSDIHQQKN